MTTTFGLSVGLPSKQMLPLCDRCLVTVHDCVRDADTYFPNLDKDPDWSIEEVLEGGTTPEGINYKFVTYKHN